MDLASIEKLGDGIRLQYDELTRNKARRMLLCICVDASASMSRVQRAETVSRGVRELIETMEQDVLVRDGLEVCLVTFGNGAKVELDLGPLSSAAKAMEASWRIQPTGSLSELGAGVQTALKCLDARTKTLSSVNRSYYVPCLIIISDGEATDLAHCAEIGGEVCRRIREGSLKVKCAMLDKREEAGPALSYFTTDHRVDQIGDLQKISLFFNMLSRSISSASRQSIQHGELDLGWEA